MARVIYMIGHWDHYKDGMFVLDEDNEMKQWPKTNDLSLPVHDYN